METAVLKRFAQAARRTLTEQVAARVNLVLMPQSAARREAPQALAELEKEIKEHGQHAIIEKVAYTWFNRFCALRFMDVNGYNSIRMVSPLDEQTQPEILAEAKMGHIDERIVSQQAVQQKIYALLEGRLPSHTPEQEAYRLLLVAACNYWQPAMPFMFERIADYTELLMPDDLLSSNSILTATREAMTAEACQDVEVIGWLYQFYISEKKDQVFDALKKNKKIEANDIPAATQLFTPHWIVRYLVENSLGRLWLLNHPQSKLAEKMPYYIAPTQPKLDEAIVFIEDIGERPYRVDRMLTGLLQSGFFARVAAVAVGHFTESKVGADAVTVEEVIRERLSSLSVPVVSGLPCGHVDDNEPLPFGAMARLDAARGTLAFEAYE